MNILIKMFSSLKKDILSIPYLEVVEELKNDPVTSEQLHAIEVHIGFPLPDDIVDFYKWSNGYKLYWKLKEDFPENELVAFADKYPDYRFEWPDSKANPFANINILPLQDALMKDWSEDFFFLKDLDASDEFTIEGKKFSVDDLKKNLKPCDMFWADTCVAFFIDRKSKKIRLLYVTMYENTILNSRVMDFSSYLAFLQATKGIAEARLRFLSEENGLNMAPLIMTPDYFEGKIKQPDGKTVSVKPSLFVK
jgi:hypothetical protein